MTGHVRLSDAAALIGRRHELCVAYRGGCGDELIAQQVLIESFRACERAAVVDLAAIAGGRSLRSISRLGAAVPAADYHEGVAAALAEARQAIEALVDRRESGQSARAALLDVRGLSPSRTRGPAGPEWTGYLAGGLDVLDQIIDNAEGRDALDA